MNSCIAVVSDVVLPSLIQADQLFLKLYNFNPFQYHALLVTTTL